MTEASTTKSAPSHGCSFCGESASAAAIVQGPAVQICERCVRLCVDVLEEKRTASTSKAASEQAAWLKLALRVRETVILGIIELTPLWSTRYTTAVEHGLYAVAREYSELLRAAHAACVLLGVTPHFIESTTKWSEVGPRARGCVALGLRRTRLRIVAAQAEIQQWPAYIEAMTTEAAGDVAGFEAAQALLDAVPYKPFTLPCAIVATAGLFGLMRQQGVEHARRVAEAVASEAPAESPAIPDEPKP